MKFFILTIGLFLFSPHHALAKVDLSLCAEFAKNNGTSTNNLSGVARHIARGESVQGSTRDTLIKPLPEGKKQETTLKWVKKGKQWVIQEVRISVLKPVTSKSWGTTTTTQVPERRTTTTFRIQNGKCIPTQVEQETFGKDGPKVLVNTKICNDMNNFFKRHKEAAKCLTPAITKNLAGFLNKAYKRNTNPYSGDSPLLQAYAIRQTCQNIPVMDKIVGDKKLWRGVSAHRW